MTGHNKTNNDTKKITVSLNTLCLKDYKVTWEVVENVIFDVEIFVDFLTSILNFVYELKQEVKFMFTLSLNIICWLVGQYPVVNFYIATIEQKNL